MNTVAIGQTTPLSQLGINTNEPIVLKFHQKGLAGIDISCYALDKDDRLVSDDYEVFFTELASVCDGIKLNNSDLDGECSKDGRTGEFEVDIPTLAGEIECVLFAISADLPLSKLCSHSRKHIDLLSVELFQDNQKTQLNYPASMLGDNTANILLRISRKDGDWVLSNTTEIFNGGLRELFTRFGGNIGSIGC